MTSLRVTHDGASTVADASRAYVVGRGQIADVHVEGASVSRHHLDLIFDGTTWSAVDRSSAGTYVDGVAVDQVAVDRLVRMTLGSPTGPLVVLEPDVAPPPTPVMDVPEEHSQVGTIAFDDRALRLDLGDQHLAVRPGTTIVIGRDEGCDLTSSDRLVSGQHCSFAHDGSHWVLTDLDSTRGTFVDGQRLRKPMEVEGAFHVGLGDPAAGAQLRVVTAGEHRPPRSRPWVATALVGAGMLLVGLVVLQQLLPSDVNTPEQLSAAKQATVLLFDPGSGASGSGALVSDALILTNRHVAELAPELIVAVSEQEDAPVAVRYGAETVAMHPYLDLALLRIVRGVDPAGLQFTDAPMTPIPGLLEVGDSTSIQAGDGMHALGFPGVTSAFGASAGGDLVTPAVTVAAGEAVTFQSWPGCDDPDVEALLVEGGASSACAPEGPLARGNLVTSQLSGSGASGGPVIVDGRIVAVVYAGQPPQIPDPETGGPSSTRGTGTSIPTEYFTDWLDEQLQALAE